MTPNDSGYIIYFILLLALPLIILLIAVALSVRYPHHRKRVGIAMIGFGVAEVLPFFVFNVIPNYYLSPLINLIAPLSFVFIEGCITIVAGVAMLKLTRPKIVATFSESVKTIPEIHGKMERSKRETPKTD